MERDQAIDLIESLGGDEHDWVDFKQDYYITGIELRKAEYVKDVAAMANTISDEDLRYIIVGVDNESGNLVGVSEDFESTAEDQDNDLKHILELDDAHLQSILTEYLSPAPNIDLHTFVGQDPKFGVLSVQPLNKKPCVVEKSIEFSGSTHLQKGVIYTRKASRNTIVTRSVLEDIINERIADRRTEILDGITKAVQIGPEVISKFGDFVNKKEGDLTIDVGKDEDFVVDERITREPASDLDIQLNQDISQWASRDEIEMESAPLWEYYAHSDDLSMDEQATLFLTHASIKHKVFGLYWLQYVNQDKIRGILDSVPSKHHQNMRAATAYAALGDHTGLSNFCEERDITSDSILSLKQISEKNEEGRYRNLIEEEKHEISCEDIDIQMRLSELNPTEIREKIPMISKNLYTVEDRIDVYNKWVNIRNNIRELLGDLEIKLAIYSI